ncbi:hypothetical protein WA588_005348 [Blastocystis sp. NMH]
METADERRNHEGVGVIKITESMGMPCEGFMIPDKYKEYLGSVLLTKGMVKDRTAKLASDIKSDYDGKRFILICILKGAYPFFSELCRQLQNLGQAFSYEFLRVKRTTADGAVEINISETDLNKVHNYPVIIVEDIVDTGETIKEVTKYIKSFNPKSVKTCVLIEKDNPHRFSYTRNYCGYQAPYHFIVGYGIDCCEKFRDLDHICLMTPEGVKWCAENEDKLL